MTYDEAVAALAADPTAVVFAGRDFDSLAAAVRAIPSVPSEFMAPGTVSPVATLAAVQRDIASAADTPSRLMALKGATATLAGILAAREREIAAGLAIQADTQRRMDENRRAREAASARTERLGRAMAPAFQTLRHRSISTEVSLARSVDADEYAALRESLAAEFASFISVLDAIGSALLSKAA